MDLNGQEPNEVNINVQDPFKNWPRSKLAEKANECIRESSLRQYEKFIVNGAYLAQDPDARLDFEGWDHPPAVPRNLEDSSIWERLKQQPLRLYGHVLCCGLGAIVQGMDESAINGAQLYYVNDFPRTKDSRIKGLVNGAPYLCCMVSCLLTGTLNKWFGRRNTIALTCLLSFGSVLGQALARDWRTLLVWRIVLGLGVGPKSATIPIYSSECVPKEIRGALVMQWQAFTALGIMLGLGFDLAFINTGKNNWRFMIGSPMVAPFILFLLLFSQPESPRWHLQQAFKRLKRAGDTQYEEPNDRLEDNARRHFKKAYMALDTLRYNDLETGRDFFLLWYLLKDKTKNSGMSSGSKRMFDLVKKPRCYHAFTAGLTVMFLQQFCGVNILAYYSSTVYKSADVPNIVALSFSLGFGAINWIFSIPTMFIIDHFGRRKLLLATFPLMAIFQLGVALSFLARGVSRRVLVVLFSYLFAVAYSVGEGPVPFLYASESLPLYNRDYGMGIITAVNWALNFLVAMTWPSIVDAFGDEGSFIWYAGWCIIGFFMILFLVPETTRYSLEELDDVFKKSYKDLFSHGLMDLKWWWHYCTLGNPGPRPQLVQRLQADEIHGFTLSAMEPLKSITTSVMAHTEDNERPTSSENNGVLSHGASVDSGVEGIRR